MNASTLPFDDQVNVNVLPLSTSAPPAGKYTTCPPSSELSADPCQPHALIIGESGIATVDDGEGEEDG
jgi:hypothetical protein